MTKSLFINFRDRGFWAYDVPSSVFLKFLIDAAIDRVESEPSQWLADAVQNWRVTAAIPELSHFTEDVWSQSQIETVIELSRSAVNTIRTYGDISAQEIESWSILENLRIFTLGNNQREVSLFCRILSNLGSAIRYLNGGLV